MCNPQAGSDARSPDPGQGPRQPAAPETPHLLSSLHRFLGRLQQQDYVPPQIPLYSNGRPQTALPRLGCPAVPIGRTNYPGTHRRYACCAWFVHASTPGFAKPIPSPSCA